MVISRSFYGDLTEEAHTSMIHEHRHSMKHIFGRPIFLFGVATAAAVFGAAVLGGCQPTAAPAGSSVALAKDEAGGAAAAGSGPVQFVEVAEKAGLGYQWEVAGEQPYTILQTIGNGCAFLDYNRDNNLDVLLVGRRLALFAGDGRGNFTDVSSETGLSEFSEHFLGCAVGDYDNDGDSDLYISGYRSGRLLRNEGGARFRDVTSEMGLKAQPWGTSCGFADLDNDGFLDLYIANYIKYDLNTKPQLCEFATEKHGLVLSSCGPKLYQGLKGVLYHNQGGRGFKDVTQSWGASSHSGKGLGVAFADFDHSGRVGLAVANDEVAGDLFQNLGQGRLKNIGTQSGTAYDRDGSVHGGMGADWGDYNNDGQFDLFVATYRNEGKSLYRNEGGKVFSDVSFSSGIGQVAYPYVAFGTKFLDADNDGWLDLMLANGHVMDNIEKIENSAYRQPVQFLRNQGGKPTSFEDASRSAGLQALPHIVGRGLAVGDYDNDGRPDALVVDSSGKPLLLHNQSKVGKTSWVGFALSAPGAKVNRDAYGAIITVMAGGQKLMRQCQTAGSYLSASDARVHIGLGDAALESVTVRWPDGVTETWKGDEVPVGRYCRLVRGQKPQ